MNGLNPKISKLFDLIYTYINLQSQRILLKLLILSMIKEFGVLFFVLLALLVGWSLYEKTKWPIDYTALTP
jgi:hypothetical protein